MKSGATICRFPAARWPGVFSTAAQIARQNCIAPVLSVENPPASTAAAVSAAQYDENFRFMSKSRIPRYPRKQSDAQ